MLHYNLRHVSSSTMFIFMRSNCIITASSIVTLCKRLYSVPDESALIRHTVLYGPTDLPRVSPAQHFKTFEVLLCSAVFKFQHYTKLCSKRSFLRKFMSTLLVRRVILVNGAFAMALPDGISGICLASFVFRQRVYLRSTSHSSGDFDLL